MTLLVFQSLVNPVTPVTINPYSPPPTGWLKPASANTAQITVASGVAMFNRSSGSAYAIWYDQSALGAPVIGSKTVVGNANSSALGGSCVIEGDNGNGYAAVHASFGTAIEVIKLTASAKDGASLAVITTAIVNNTTEIDIRFDKATSTIRVYKNGVQVGPDVVDTTYDPIYAGVCAGPGRSTSVETYQIGVEVAAVTDPIVLGSPIAWTSTFTNPITGISAIGMSATNIDNVNDDADWPALADGMVIEQSLPTASLPILFSDGTNTATRNATINLDPDFTSLIIASPNNTNPKYIGSVYPLTAGWFFYWEEDQPSGNIVLYADGRVSASASGDYVVYVHKVGDDDTAYQLNLSVNNDDPDTEGNGITMVGITAVGVTMTGITMVGL